MSTPRKKIEYTPLSAAPTLDDVYEAFRKNRIMASPRVLELFKGAVSPGSKFEQHVEQFNFGVLKNSAINEAEREARDFIEHKVFTNPFPICLYRVSIDFEDGKRPYGVSLLVVDGEGDERYPGYAVVQFTHSAEWMVAMHSINTLTTKVLDGGVAVEVQVPKKEFFYWRDTIAGTEKDRPVEIGDIADGCRLAMGLTMIINTKGVRKERSAPPEKPNKARAKAGRPLLPWVTRVYTDVYNRAIEPGTGTHASPRPHRRRAHVRHYPATPYREGYSIPIAAMLVNWDGQPLAERNQYEVHHDAT